MKNTILSSKDAKLLEKILIEKGDVVTVDQIFSVLKDNNTARSLRNFIDRMAKKGWLVRLEKGKYLITDLLSRGYVEKSSLLVANALVKDSYVSFGFALQHYGMFDQMQSVVTSISLNRHRTKTIQDITYKFIYTQQKYFFGWEEIRIEDNNVRIATKEKALIDMLQYHRSFVSVDLVIEKLKEYTDEIDIELLKSFANRSTVSVRRVLGFILDLLQLNSEGLKLDQSVSKITSDSTEFSSKWRLYFDKQFLEHQI